MKDIGFTHRADDGLAIHVHGFGASDGEPRAVLHIVHGMAEHGGRYARVAEAFTREGFAVYAHDHRGHGRSVPPGRSHGHVAERDGFSKLVTDAHGVNRAIAARHPNLPLVLLGHSMGSFVVQTMLFEHPGDCVACVLSGSGGAPPLLAKLGRLVARLEVARVGPRGVSGIIRALTFGDFNRNFRPNRTPSDWISRDEKEVDAYVADPFCGFDCDVACWRDLFDALDVRVHDPKLQATIASSLPLYIFSGDRDAVGEMGKSVRALAAEYARAGLRDVTLELYPGARHETLNETNRDEVTRDLVAWVLRVVPSKQVAASA